ncbi:YbaN family protein [Ancylobacter sp. 6x-1]|uniref:YbaN family protein n=1 Tax=Ancylobacter crimeensis TaxID=2579147 RepID=A0ABT0DCV2_9HYPH|nr:YbaN family protein [Ancylobacter crimeensis]MCK0197782.1 YbaN family protein [Ancylobacter crimeensis]
MSDMIPPPPASLARPALRTRFASGPLRWVMIGLGWLCVALGIIGIFTPMMPGTVFLIIAAWLFSRSSPRFETWLVTHRRLGPSVVAWRRNGAVPRWAKIFAVVSMAFSFGLLVVMGLPVLVLAGTAACFVGVAAYLISRPSA